MMSSLEGGELGSYILNMFETGLSERSCENHLQVAYILPLWNVIQSSL